ncbi:GGDEF domain-containing protein [Jiella sp. MQZ9-1]|nr:GGDEF domain-containing protein [Jiella flava]
MILLLAMGTCLIAGVAMLAEWRSFREPAAGWWAIGFMLSVVGLVVFQVRYGYSLDVLSIGVSNSLILGSYSVICAGLAVFCGRTVNLPAVFLPSFAWIIFWSLSPSSSNFDTRVIVVSVITAMISALSAWYCFACKSHWWLKVLGWVMVMRMIVSAARAFWSGGLFGPLLGSERAVGFEMIFIEGLWTSVLVSYLMFTNLRQKRESSLIKLAETDFLTGADNRRSFQIKAEPVLAQTHGGRTASLVTLDLDNFKQINDSRGHAFGDEVLQRFASIVRRHIGPQNIFARTGGEEFAILLPDQDAARSTQIAEKIRSSFEREMDGFDLGTIAATVSVGIITVSRIHALDALMLLVDEALYQAKTNGRNRVERAIEPAETPVPEGETDRPRLQLST